MSKSGNRDPWGDVYKVCMGKSAGVRISSMKANGRMTSTWREGANVLMERFFPAAGMRVERLLATNEVMEEGCFEWNEVNAAVGSMRRHLVWMV